jgi:hypothetical protein
MGANEISNRMVAGAYVKAGTTGDNPNMNAAGVYTYRAQSGFKDSILVSLPDGVVPSDPIEEQGEFGIGLVLERPIARSQLVYHCQMVVAGEASTEDPAIYSQELSGEVLCLGTTEAAYRAWAAGGPVIFEAPTVLATFDPIDMILVLMPPDDNGHDLMCTVWEVPLKGPALPPEFINFPAPT